MWFGIRYESVRKAAKVVGYCFLEIVQRSKSNENLDVLLHYRSFTFLWACCCFWKKG